MDMCQLCTWEHNCLINGRWRELYGVGGERGGVPTLLVVPTAETRAAYFSWKT